MAMWGLIWSLSADLRILQRTNSSGNVGADVVSEFRFEDPLARKY